LTAAETEVIKELVTTALKRYLGRLMQSLEGQKDMTIAIESLALTMVTSGLSINVKGMAKVQGEVHPYRFLLRGARLENGRVIIGDVS
jgi:hypothetical protein